MLARWKSEIAYVRGLVRVLRRTKGVTATPNKTAGDYLEDWARLYGDRPALLSDRESLSYRELDARANSYARWARDKGIGKGDVVALMMPNRPEYVAVWMGLARAGAAVALINTNLVGASLAHCAAVVNAKTAIVDSTQMPAFGAARPLMNEGLAVYVHGGTPGAEARIDRELETISAAPLAADERPAQHINDPLLFIYTSGTTGMPKAARVTHSRVLRAMFGFAAACDSGPDDRMYVCLPMYHSNGGMLGIGVALSVGGSCFLRERFSASEFWNDIVTRQCTMFIYIGELCRYLLNAPTSANERAHRVRLCFGNGLRPDVFSQFQSRFGIRNVLEFYASTEGNAVLLNLDSHPGAVGRLPGWAAARFPIKIVAFDIDENTQKRGPDGFCVECGPDEVGELLAEILDDPKKPASRFDGYADGAATKTKILNDVFKKGDSWFRTGDLLRRDARGYYYFIDRIGDTFRWKGENVSTTEVEETISTFPGVKEAIVYGVAAPHHDGRAGMAALVVENIAGFDLAGLRAHLEARLPAYARPVFLRFRTELDITGTFKPKKTALVAEGFDPARIGDSVFVDDRASATFRRIDADFLTRLSAGTIKL